MQPNEMVDILLTNQISNRTQLLSHGQKQLRRIAFKLINAALEMGNPYYAVKKLVDANGNTLRVGAKTYDLSKERSIYVLGAGKATFYIARALEDILGDKITDGLVVLKKGHTGTLSRIEIVEASHPIPESNGIRGAMEMFRFTKKIREGDIVFSCITGGSSALLPMPVDSVTLTEKKKVSRLLLSSGASIREINCVRKHLSKIKGGRLALSIFPGELINFTVSDVIGDPLDYITDPTVPDTSTFEDALRTLRKYDLLDRVPASVRSYLEAADPSCETPKDFGANRCHNFVLTNNSSACEAAAAAAESAGLRAIILSTMFDGESRELGRTFAAIAKEIRRFERPLAPPCVLIGGGETVVTLSKNFGKGGPNQEFVASAVLNMDGDKNFVVVGLDTDGTDGPTTAAGAIADTFTIPLARSRGVDLEKALKEHKVFPALASLDEIIITGQTGTNVNDLKFLILT